MNVCLIDCIDGPNSLLLLLKIGHSAPLFHSELDTTLSLVIEMLSNRTVRGEKSSCALGLTLTALAPSPEP